eukprot:scaffold1607_cov417-Prasinococcus_capsulatus_cf.AAC.1
MDCVGRVLAADDAAVGNSDNGSETKPGSDLSCRFQAGPWRVRVGRGIAAPGRRDPCLGEAEVARASGPPRAGGAGKWGGNTSA